MDMAERFPIGVGPVSVLISLCQHTGGFCAVLDACTAF
jgi:hypothetical protein